MSKFAAETGVDAGVPNAIAIAECRHAPCDARGQVCKDGDVQNCAARKAALKRVNVISLKR